MMQKILKKTMKKILPLLFDLTKFMISDKEYRKLMSTVLDILRNSYGRSQVVSGTDDDSLDSDSEPPTELKYKEKIENARKYMDLTEDEKEILLKRLSKTLINVRKHPEYHLLFQNIFQLYDDMILLWVKIQNNSELESVYKESSTIATEIKVLLERSCNHPITRWVELVNDLIKIRDEPKYIQVRDTIEDLLFDPNDKYQSESEIKESYNIIKDDLNELNDKNENLFDELYFESRCIIDGISNDPVYMKLSRDLNSLIKEIFTDEKGQPSIISTTESITRIRDIFFPIIKKYISLISLPIIEIESDNYFFRMQDLKINLAHIAPDQLLIATDSAIKLDTGKLKRHGHLNLNIKFEKITTEIEKLRFQMKKKTFIKYSDSGLVNIYLRDTSIMFHFNLILESNKVDKIILNKVDVDLSNMKIKILEAKHDVLDKIITTVFLPILRSKIRKNVRIKYLRSYEHRSM